MHINFTAEKSDKQFNDSFDRQDQKDRIIHDEQSASIANEM